MHFSANFDLDEFLAYLIPGGLLLAVIAWMNFELLEHLIPKEMPKGLLGSLLTLSSVIALALASGHALSIFSRVVVRTVLNAAFGDPDDIIFRDARRSRSFGAFTAYFSDEVIVAIESKFNTIFGHAASAPGYRLAAPRIIRSYVISANTAVRVQRERIVRTRAMCANLFIPCLLLAIVLFRGGGAAAGSLLFSASLLLIAKQRILDVRETKEVYIGFIVPSGNDHAK
jgi:hypothetical protein